MPQSRSYIYIHTYMYMCIYMYIQICVYIYKLLGVNVGIIYMVAGPNYCSNSWGNLFLGPALQSEPKYKYPYCILFRTLPIRATVNISGKPNGHEARMC